ncbi:MAG: glucose-phosphate thymidylyltransferase [Chitinophagaceae bacterium]|jgi:UDP-N-acetylglucosamine diphosphorylase/glucosamine-1-phosphate N-acetyltransferase|nr:glucose-phosphate thymidylyltransferase [Chitinophagaceae bacterium]
MSYVLFDTAARKKLYPLTYTRAVADIRIGIVTLKEWWEKMLDEEVFVKTDDYLQPLYQAITPGDHTYIDAAVLPMYGLPEKVKALQAGESLTDETNTLIAYRNKTGGTTTLVNGRRRLEYPWQVFQWNDEILREQFEWFRQRRLGFQTSESTHIINSSQVVIEEGAVVEHVVLNAAEGPIYIGKNVTIMEGCFIRGPFAIGEGSVVKMGTKIYGATTAGPGCTLGGEIRSSVLFGNTNKGHDGYLGHSVIGEWCNLGAGTSNSNLKNSAGDICMWDFDKESNETVGKKCGVIMGDYTRTAINSSINTGSMFGVSCNIFGNELLPKRIGNFSWGSETGGNYDPQKAIQHINNWKALKGSQLSAGEEKMLAYIFAHFKG